MCDKYLLLYHRNTILEILEDQDENKHFSINIKFLELFEHDLNLGNRLLKGPEKSLDDWDAAIRKVQSTLILDSDRELLFKNRVHCRFYLLPICPELRRTKFPRNEDANKFLQVSGTVVRMTCMKMLECQRQYICAKCKYVMIVKADFTMKNIIKPPKRCGNPEECKGTNFICTGEPDVEFCKDYQEIKMQETVSKLDVGCMPSSMWVTLEDDLVDLCKPGDNITVCGVVKRRWNQFIIGKKMDIELVLKANHIQVNNNSSTIAITSELKDMFQAFWKTYCDRPLVARDIILKSICPQLFGLNLVKLATAVVLAGGSHAHDSSSTGVTVRAEPHLLLVGDPGTGKSELLRFASKIIPRSVLTTGVGSTAAGLTVTAVMENGEWQLEAGALVLSDGGICCIDEFNSMKEHDRTSIHEAMEQQTISVAKASIVCKLSTRCSILAATNPKGNLDPSQPLSMNVALASPLLSRFDLILLLRDKVNNNWDHLVADYILSSQHNSLKLTENVYWSVETLQAYFAIIKKIHPVLTEDSNRILSSYYQAQRRKNCRNKSRTTVRLLDSLVRLSQGHARLMHHEEVQVIDAVIAVMLVETAMEADSSVFDLRFDVQNDFPESPMKTYRELVEVVLKKLQLDDLLQQELEVINKYESSSSCGAQVPSTTLVSPIHRTESRFFYPQNQPTTTKAGDASNPRAQVQQNNTETSNERINIKKVNKSKENNNRTSLEITALKDKTNIGVNNDELNDMVSPKINENNEVLKDLAALKCMPSVNDIFTAGMFEFDDVGSVDLNLDDDKGVNAEKKMAKVESCETKVKEVFHSNGFEDLVGGELLLNPDDKDITEHKATNDSKFVSVLNSPPQVNCDMSVIREENGNGRKSDGQNEPVLSQRTIKRKRLLSKFKFVPKESKENLISNNDTNFQENSDQTEIIPESLENISFSGFENVPQSTQKSPTQKDTDNYLPVVKKFKFKEIRHESIFENNDVNDLDLDI